LQWDDVQGDVLHVNRSVWSAAVDKTSETREAQLHPVWFKIQI
jgi:hypothetical protein